jgi:hypothetical protein
MKKIVMALLAVFAAAFTGQAQAADFEFHGDMNHRFNLYTDQAGMFSGVETVKKYLGSEETAIQKDGVDEFWGEIKYRLWTTASTNDGAVKGTYAVELGGLRFGDSDYGKGGGGGFSGDGNNIETRFAYTDIEMPCSCNHMVVGLQPFSVNKYLWNETAMGIQFKGKAQTFDYTLAWMRGDDVFNDDDDDDLLEDVDSFLIRGDFQFAESVNSGLFGLYQQSNGDLADDLSGRYLVKQFGDNEFDIYTLGTDGSFTTPTDSGNFFVNWDLMYQGGDVDNDTNDEDISAYFIHADAGVNIDRVRLTYTGWYASGDDDPTDGDRENFTATDVDTFDSIIFFEGGYTDDNYFTEAPYILNYGMIFNKIAADYKATEKTTFGGAVIYAMTAEDLPNGEDTLGTEVDAYVSHKLYPNVELALNAGYLFSDDGMGYWGENGEEEDVFRSTARIRYNF